MRLVYMPPWSMIVHTLDLTLLRCWILACSETKEVLEQLHPLHLSSGASLDVWFWPAVLPLVLVQLGWTRRLELYAS